MIEVMQDIITPQQWMTRNRKAQVAMGRADIAAQRYHRLPNPIMPNTVDTVNWAEWDRLTTGAGANTAAQYTFFQVPIGQAGKTKVDTSLTLPGSLKNPDWMNVQYIGFEPSGDMVKQDIDQFFNNYYMEFWVGEKVYAQGPFPVFPSGTGLYGATTRNNEGSWSNGQPCVANMFDLRIPIGVAKGDGITGVTILQSQTFFVNVVGNPFTLSAAAPDPLNGVGLKLRCYLIGTKYRGAQ